MRRTMIVAASTAAIISAAALAQNAGPLIIEVDEPRLSAEGTRGKALFDAECARCHGAAGSGSEQGPPLIHRIYHPGHHGDMAFYRAVRQGTRAHHWNFGDMPPQPQVNPGDIPAVIRYLREVQAANGIM